MVLCPLLKIPDDDPRTGRNYITRSFNQKIGGTAGIRDLGPTGFKIFSIVTLILMLLSLYSPFGVIPGVHIGYALVLFVMHIVVPAALLYFIRRAKQSAETIQEKHSNRSYQTI